MTLFRSKRLLVVAVAAACGSDPLAPYEVLPQTAATVQSAVDFVTMGQDTVPVDCGSAITINCTGGNPGTTPAVITLTRTALSLDSLAEGSFSFGAQVTITTTGIPITIPTVGNCTLNVDTSPGTSSTAQLSGPVTFPESTHVQVVATLEGLEDDDISISGGIGCALADGFHAFVVGTLGDALSRSVILCGAPGAPLLVPCRES
jgi:hypothetical protein